MLPQPFVHVDIVHRLIHACHPLISFRLSDRERQMPGPEHGVSDPVHIVRRTAQPAAKKPEQAFPGMAQIGAMSRAQSGISWFQVHQVVEALDEGKHAVFATQPLIRRIESLFGLVFHGWKYSVRRKGQTPYGV